MRVDWATDIHLNFLEPPDLEAFLRSVADEEPDALLLAGDIAEADSVVRCLAATAEAAQCPVYFVLGNHDYYGGSIFGLRTWMAELAELSPLLVWMHTAGVVSLTRDTALVGHDGWGDGRFGNCRRTTVELNDFYLIRELANITRDSRLRRLRLLGDEAATHFRATLPEALDTHGHVIVLTHVPPFREAAWHEGRLSDKNWAPFFACKAAGDALSEIMQERPDRRMTVLCGHTHGGGVADILPNLRVYTGAARYGRPELQEALEVE